VYGGASPPPPLEGTRNLLLGAWQSAPGFSNIVGDNQVKALTNAASATATFYRAGRPFPMYAFGSR
jgi:hypothetical protein